MTWKKYVGFAVLALIVIATLGAGLVAYKNNYTQEEVDSLVANATDIAKQEGVDSVDITADNDGVVAAAIEQLRTETVDLEVYTEEMAAKDTEVERLTQILADYELAEDEVAQETAAAEAKEEIELELGESFGNKVYDDGDIDTLYDGEIRFDGTNYDVHEELWTTSELVVAYSLLDDEEFADEPAIITKDEGALGYFYIFDDPIDIDDISRDEPLEINFLGQPLVITEVDFDEFEIRAGEDWLNTGETIELEDHTITLDSVDENGESAGIIVDDEFVWLDEGEDTEVNGISVSVEKVIAIYSNDYDGRAKLIVTTEDDVYLTFEDGDSYIYDEKEKDAVWVYDLQVSGNDLEAIGIKHNQQMDEVDDDDTPLTEGDNIVFPNDFAVLNFDSVNVQDYNDITIEFDDIEDEVGDEYNGMIFRSDDDEGFEICDEETDIIYAWTNDVGASWVLAFEDDEGDIIDACTDDFKIVFKDYELDVSFNNDVLDIGYFEFEIGLNDDDEFAYLGNEEEDAENDEVMFNGISIGTREYDVLAFDGIILRSPEDNGDDDYIEITVPEDVLEVTSYLG